ncbi:MAG TPA: MFS transporter [Anaerolineaceae bacterium]|nr:MFS transporter [Anaerolineaceae bacterium]
MRLIDYFKVPPALKHRKFALLWAGLLISIAGTQMQVWSIYWHLRLLTDQPIAVSGVGIARLVPILMFALIGGLFADTFNRRNVMFVTQTFMLLCAFLLGWLTHFGQMTIWTIYIVFGISGIAVAFDGPSRQSLITNLVPREDLRSAFGLQSIASNTGAIIGPALSGLVIATLGIEWSYWFNAISFLAVIAALIVMGKVEKETPLLEENEKRVKPKLDIAGIPEGIRFILKQPIILSSMLLDFFASFFSSANTLLPFVAQDILKVGAIGYGWLSAAQSVGSVTVAFILAQTNRIRHQGKLLLWGITVFGFATILFGLSHNFALTFAALVLIGAGDAVSTVLRNTIRQLQTPDALRGRMISINQIFFAGGPRLGEMEAGLVAQAFGTPISIITGGIGCLISVVVVALKFPQLRNYKGDEPLKAGVQIL